MIMPTYRKGAITYGIFSITGTRRGISGISGRARHTGGFGVSRGRARGIPGDSGRRSSADISPAAICPANADRYICHRPRRDQTLLISQHLHLAEQRRAILVLSDLRRTHFDCRVQMVRVLLGILRHRFESDSLVYVLLRRKAKENQPAGCSLSP